MRGNPAHETPAGTIMLLCALPAATAAQAATAVHGLYAAVMRRRRDGLPEDGWYADQASSRAEALRSFTLDAAFAAHQEDRLGSLERGKWADFIVIDRDYFEIAEDEIDDIRVLETWVGGKRVFSDSRIREDQGAVTR